MRISDWSSDVCSSDLQQQQIRAFGRPDHLRSRDDAGLEIGIGQIERIAGARVDRFGDLRLARPQHRLVPGAPRSEERRVGKECVSTCRSRWWPDQLNKKTLNITIQSTTQKHIK